MKEYIERTAVIPALEDYYKPIDPDRPMTLTLGQIAEVVKNMTASDVVEVVRCKNCRFFSGRQECYCHAADENGTPIFVREDDFCSYGARMEKGDEHGS